MADSLLVAVLAAGASRRLGRPKQLVQVDGNPLVRRQSRVALDAQIGRVAVILGCDAQRCAAALDGLPVMIRVNDQWQQGLSASIRAAIDLAVHERSLGLLVLHCDQYRVTAQDLHRLCSVWMTNRTLACRACHQDYCGPPVILPEVVFPLAMALQGDEGARRLLGSLGANGLVDVDMPNAMYDLDSPGQLSELEGLPLGPQNIPRHPGTYQGGRAFACTTSQKV